MSPVTRRLLPLLLLALAGIGSAAWTAYRTVRTTSTPPLPLAVPERPYPLCIAASGLIETRGEDTIVGVPEAQIVSEVAVGIGDRVVPGQLLFRLDDRLLRAELLQAQADAAIARSELAAATAQLARLQALPRADDALPVAAQVAVVQAEVADAQRQLARNERLAASHAIAAAELDLRRGAEAISQAALARAQADLAHVRLGPWAPDLAVARSAIVVAEARSAAAEARSAAIRVRIERLSVRSARTATVLRSTVTIGQAAVPGDPTLMRLGDADHLRVRVEVDESQAAAISATAPARGWIRGDPTHTVALAFVRIEPLAEVRAALPGTPGERLDARAIQVLYDLVAAPAHVRPGVLLEVDLAIEPVEHATQPVTP